MVPKTKYFITKYNIKNSDNMCRDLFLNKSDDYLYL